MAIESVVVTTNISEHVRFVRDRTTRECSIHVGIDDDTVGYYWLSRVLTDEELLRLDRAILRHFDE